IFTRVNGAASRGIVRLNSDGTLDESFKIGDGFGWSSGQQVGGLDLDSAGRILVTGDFDQFNGMLRTNICRLNGDGTLDQSFDARLGGYPDKNNIMAFAGAITLSNQIV